jgi:hypothetical protein
VPGTGRLRKGYIQVSDDYVPEERKKVSLEDAVMEKERVVALNAPGLWHTAGPFSTLNEPIDLANQPPASRPGEFFVVFAGGAFYAIWFY